MATRYRQASKLCGRYREVFPSVTHRTSQRENNRAEAFHQDTGEQERKMRFGPRLPKPKFLASPISKGYHHSPNRHSVSNRK